MYDPLVEGKGTYSVNTVESGATASTLHSAFNIGVSVVGAGMLQLPRGVSESGWIGIGLLVFLAIVAFYTGLRLIECINLEPEYKTYGDIGEAAFGRVGRWAVDVQNHVTMIGAATVYLVLSGENFHTLVPSVPARLGVVLATAVVWFHVFLKTLKEVGVLSAFNALVAFGLFGIVIIEALMNKPEGPVHTEVVRWSPALGVSFASFSFSYCVHPVLPPVYASMKNPHHYPVMLACTFFAVLCIYVPMSAVGYSVYGHDVDNIIYLNLPKGPAVTIVIIAVTVHVMCSYAIVISPTEQALEGKFRVEERGNPLLWRVAVRSVVVVLTGAIAVAMANVFGPLLDLVSSVTSSCTVFIFPCLIYLRLFRDRGISPLSYIWNGLIIVLALAGAGFGAYNAIKEIKEQFNS